MSESPGSVAVITGAGSGIGRATAAMLADLGWRLVLVGRTERTLVETASLLPAKAAALPLVADVSGEEGAAAVIDAAVREFGRLDALVNNAGVAPNHPIGQTTPRVIRECYEVNALGPALAIARAWPILVGQGGGCIVNLSTMGTVDPFPGFFAYAPSKAPVNLMALICAREGAEHGIRAFAVAPGAVETPMLRRLWSEEVLPRERVMAPEAVARVIVECIRGERDGQNGQTILVPPPDA